MTIDMTFERREALIRRDERAEGKVEGIAEGKTAGLKLAVAVMMKNMHISQEEAEQLLREEEQMSSTV